MRRHSLFAFCIGVAVFGSACSGGGGSGQAGDAGGSGGSGGCPQRELFSNGNFDLGGSGWSESSARWPSVVVTAAAAGGGVTPQSGSYLARLGGYPEAAQDTLTGTVNVPEAATNLVFSYSWMVKTEETASTPHDTLFAALDSDTVYAEQTVDNTDVHPTWQRFEKAIDGQAAGKTLVMIVRAENDAEKATTFLLDSVSLTANICP